MDAGSRDRDGCSFQCFGVDEQALPYQRSGTALQEGQVARNGLVHLLVVHVGAADPDHLGTGGVIARPYGQRERAVGIAGFLCGRRAGIKVPLAVGILGGIQQRFRRHIVCLGDGDALCHREHHMGALIHAVQRGAFVGGRVVREQRVRVAVQRVARIALHHKARLTRKAELCHHCIQIGRFGITAGGQQHLAAVFQIGLQLRDLIHKAVSCKIRKRGR